MSVRYDLRLLHDFYANCPSSFNCLGVKDMCLSNCLVGRGEVPREGNISYAARFLTRSASDYMRKSRE